MRVSAVGFAYNDLGIVLDKAAQTAEVTHNHPEGIKGAQAIAVAIYLARIGKSKAAIKAYMTEMFEYDLDFTLDEIRPTFPFDESCQGTVPQSIVAFLESTDYDSAIRLAISLGGDSDTIACITGGIAIAFYKEMPQVIVDKIRREYLPDAFGPKDLDIAAHLLAEENHDLVADHQDDLVNQAILAANQSHCPYSNSPHGIAILFKNGDVVTGRYAENAAFNPSLPALQTALNFAYLNDKKLSDIERIVMAEKALKLSHKTMAEVLLSTLTSVKLEYHSL